MTKLEAYAPPASAAKPLSPTEHLASLRSALDPWEPGTPFWIFAYGSLMWNPEFAWDARHVATIRVYHRAFRIWSRINRGTPENPGLVLTLACGGSCRGLAYRIAPDRVQEEMSRIWKREMTFGSYRPKWLNCVVGDQTLRALAFTVNRTCSGYAGEIGHGSINFAGPLCECGNRGCLELYASSEALKEAYALTRLSQGGEAPESQEVLRLVRAGESSAQDAYRRVVSHLAFGVVGLINALNPDCVVFADRMVEGGPLFLETVDGVLRRHLMPEVYSQLKVSVNRFPGDPMLLGASVVALDNLLMRPTGAFSALKTPEGFSTQGENTARS
jgi:cation transport protein ChaC